MNIMRYFYIKNLLYLLLFVCFITTMSAQDNQKFWTKITENKALIGKKNIRKTEPLKSVYYQLDINGLKNILSSASKSNTEKGTSNLVLQFPNSEGSFDAFRVKESSILEPDYQKKHPELRTYIGQNIENPSSTISFSLTPKGFHAIILSSKTGTQFIDPYTQNNTYIVYNKGDLPRLKEAFKCYLPEDATVAKATNAKSKSLKNASDSKLRTFRLAIASTIEYSEFYWKDVAGLTERDTETAKKTAVLAGMVVTMNRVNSIFQRDLAIKMILVDNSNIIFINTDNFTNDDADSLIDESQSVINSIIGAANYDIGHTFSTGGGGLASLNSPCVDNRKARGITGSPNPIGDAYDIDYVAHEMGHQFGAPHTFNGDAGNCAGGNRNATNAYEPGSGSTIMAYAGICTPQNVQLNSDAYFHQKSIQMIWDNITTGLSTCGAEIALTNNPPVANAGPDYTIPISTAFKLVGSSTDPDGTSTHTYTWEQYDLGPAGLPEETNTTGPLVRSFEGTSSPERYIPRFLDYLATGGSTTWEKLPSVNRTLNFALTVRDNDVIGDNGGGQTDVDFMQIVVNSTDPFTVKNPVSWAQGTLQTIEWAVGQTANPGTINCQNVSIKLSTDGGLTFPTLIAASTPNDGSYPYTVPAIPNTTTARILIEAVDNIFYDVSDFDFSISDQPDFFISDPLLNIVECGGTSATFTFEYNIANSFSETTTFSASGNPVGSSVSFSPSSINVPGNVTMTVDNLDNVQLGNYNIIVTGTSTSSIIKNKTANFPYYKGQCESIANTTYQTGTTLVQFDGIFSQSSGKPSGYSSYNSTPHNINRNSAYNLTVNANTDGNYTTTTTVWIDWNQNCSFDDVGEAYNLGDATNTINGATGNSPLLITVPVDAVLGNTIMRVSTKFSGDGAPTSCENGFDGEVEDYTLNVQASLAIEEFGFDNFVVYPNPNKGEFTIKLNSSLSSNINVEVFDLRGRTIYKSTHKDAGDFNEKINLDRVQSGMYILNVSDGLRKSTKKIIVE